MTERTQRLVGGITVGAAMVFGYVATEPLTQVLVAWGVPEGWTSTLIISAFYLSVCLLIRTLVWAWNRVRQKPRHFFRLPEAP